MKKKTNTPLLIIMSLAGFIITTGALGLTFYTGDINYLYAIIPGVILSLLGLTLSQRNLPSKKEEMIQSEPEEELEYIKNQTVIEQIGEVKEEVIEPIQEIVETETPDSLTVELDIDEKTAEALLRLTEKMEDKGLVLNNPQYDFENNTDSNLYHKRFNAIPIIGLVKNRNNNFNILGGLTHDEVEVIGTIKPKDLDSVSITYPKTQNIRANITGGKYKTPQNTEHTQAHRVEVTFYT